MNAKKGTIKFLVGLFVVLAFLGGIICGGYFLLDKVVVPKYFAEYGISGMNDLVVLMRTMYSLPKEKEILNNPYYQSDLSTASKKLGDANYPVLADGTFSFELFDNGQKGDGDVYLTDRELASILDKLLDSTEFSDILPNLNSIDTININLKQLMITPEKEGEEYSKTNAHINAIFKIDTKEVRSQMAKEMDIPLFLLNMIFPEQMYITCDYTFEKIEAEWKVTNGALAVNGSDSKQSETFLNLLIRFVFKEEDEMTITKLLDNFAKIVERGTELLGDFEFASGLGTSKTLNGIYFLPVELGE